MTDPNLQHAPDHVDPEREIAIAAIDAAQQTLTAARALLVRRPPVVVASEWADLAEGHRLTAIGVSRGSDEHRNLKDFYKAHGVETSGSGRGLLARRASILAAIEARAKAPKTTATSTPEPRSDLAAVACAGRRP